MSEKFDLQCIIRGRAGEWEGFCLDFDIAVQGRSADEAIERLKTAVASYIESAMDEPEPVKARLLSRHVPWHVDLLWRLRVAMWVLRGGRKATESTYAFPIPCHA